jgi:hypothetical protein
LENLERQASDPARATRGLGLPILSSRLEKHAERLAYFREVFGVQGLEKGSRERSPGGDELID